MKASTFERMSSKVFIGISGINTACVISTIWTLFTGVPANLFLQIGIASLNAVMALLTWRLHKEAEGKAIILVIMEKEIEKFNKEKI